MLIGWSIAGEVTDYDGRKGRCGDHKTGLKHDLQAKCIDLQVGGFSARTQNTNDRGEPRQGNRDLGQCVQQVCIDQDDTFARLDQVFVRVQSTQRRANGYKIPTQRRRRLSIPLPVAVVSD